MKWFLLLILTYFFVFPQPVYAYLDPGSGSYFLQLMIGLLLGGLFSLKVYWKKVKMFIVSTLKSLKSKKDDQIDG